MWEMYWKFNKPYYQPGSEGAVNFSVKNHGPTYIEIEVQGLQFEYQLPNDEWWPCSPSRGVQVPPMKTKKVGNCLLTFPDTLTGEQKYRIFLHAWQWDSRVQEWQDMGTEESQFNYAINVFPTPVYRAFLSRGIRTEDRALGDTVAELVAEWGFETVTVGIEVQSDRDWLKEAVRHETLESDCLIALATPRSLDALTGLWRTLEWLHGEVGIAFGRDKPILILQEKSISLGGVPGEFQEFIIVFDQLDMRDLRYRLGNVMPGFREWVATKRKREFISNIGKVAIGTLAVVGIGQVASLLGGIQEDVEDKVEEDY